MIGYILEVDGQLVLHDHINIKLIGIFCFLEQLILIAITNRCQIGDTWTDIKHSHLFLGIHIHILAHLWTGAHQTHVAHKYIN